MQPITGTQDPARIESAPTDSDLTAATRPMPAVTPESNTLPPAKTVVAPSGDACPSCGALMAADQRYCVECGERRGEPRLPFMDGRTAAQPEPSAATAAPASAQSASRSKWMASLSLIAGIGVLILAMGVGVLIGTKGGSKNATAQQPVYIGGAPTAATGASGATTASSTSSSSAKKAAAASAAASGADVQSTAKANGVKLAPNNVKVGDKCAKGTAGCTGGKFTGDFFGGGQ